MGVKKNMNEQNTEKKETGKWQISLYIDNPKEAFLIADAEQLPRPDENFHSYPTTVNLPQLYSYFQMLRKVKKISSMGIYSRVSKIG